MKLLTSRNYIKVIIVLIICVFAFEGTLMVSLASGVFDDITEDPFSNGAASATATKAIDTVWRIAKTTMQVLAIVAIVFAGARYIFASADQKADLKKSMGILALGGVLTFATFTLIGFIVKIADEVL